MNDKLHKDSNEALDSFFSVIREEATSNPQFARRIHEAIGNTVKFEGAEALQAVDPVLLAGRGLDEFRQSFIGFAPAELKKLMKEYGLATAPDFKGKTKTPMLVDLMWERASQKLRDLSPE